MTRPLHLAAYEVDAGCCTIYMYIHTPGGRKGVAAPLRSVQSGKQSECTLHDAPRALEAMHDARHSPSESLSTSCHKFDREHVREIKRVKGGHTSSRLEAHLSPSLRCISVDFSCSFYPSFSPFSISLSLFLSPSSVFLTWIVALGACRSRALFACCIPLLRHAFNSIASFVLLHPFLRPTPTPHWLAPSDRSASCMHLLRWCTHPALLPIFLFLPSASFLTSSMLLISPPLPLSFFVRFLIILAICLHLSFLLLLRPPHHKYIAKLLLLFFLSSIVQQVKKRNFY